LPVGVAAERLVGEMEAYEWQPSPASRDADDEESTLSDQMAQIAEHAWDRLLETCPDPEGMNSQAAKLSRGARDALGEALATLAPQGPLDALACFAKKATIAQTVELKSWFANLPVDLQEWLTEQDE
jgi:hypothetical protein